MQIFLTEAFTFMVRVLCATGYPGTSAIGVKMQLHFVPDKHFNSVQTHFAGKIRKYDLAGYELDPKESIGKRLVDDSFYNL